MKFENCNASAMQMYEQNVVGEEVRQEKFQGKGQENANIHRIILQPKKEENFILDGVNSKDKVKIKAQ